MLCVNRMTGERVIIRVPNGPMITIAIVRVGKGKRVRLGIDAPASISVDREEIDTAKRNEAAPAPQTESATRSMVKLWRAMGEPMHLTDDSLIRQAAEKINELTRENATLNLQLTAEREAKLLLADEVVDWGVSVQTEYRPPNSFYDWSQNIGIDVRKNALATAAIEQAKSRKEPAHG
jgi:sRNA-binding carbon storage regulator CsrA